MSQDYALAHLLGGVMLLTAFAMLSQRRLATMIGLYRVEAVTLAAVAFWQGFMQVDMGLLFTGVVTLAVKAVILPRSLRRIVQRFGLTRVVDTAMPVGVAMMIGVALVGMAVLVVLPVTLDTLSVTREDMAMSLAVVLLGLLVMTTRRQALARVIGFLVMENGLMLAACGLPGMPFVAELAVALLVLVAALVAGVVVCLDLGGIEPTEQRGR